MGEGGTDSLFKVLWRGKFYIILVFTFMVMAVAGAYFYLDSRDLSSRLSQMDSDLNGINDRYNKLSYDYSELSKNNDDLARRYSDVNDRYNKLAVDDQYLRSSYDGLNGTINRFQETGGVVIALYYSFYQAGSQSDPKKVMEATAYNVGNKRADKLTIKCRVINNGSTSVSEQAFANVDPLDKRRSRWEYSNTTQLVSVWVET
jgi:hypothetical protein